MHFTLVIALCFLSSWVNAQIPEKVYKPFRPDTSNLACVKQMMQAESDFASNKDTIILNRPIPSFSNTQQKVLKTRFGINTTYPPIFIDNCYNYRLKELQNVKFNQDVFAASKAAADSLDKAGLGTRQQQPNFKATGLSDYIKNSLSNKDLRTLKRDFGDKQTYIGVAIDSTGECRLIGFTNKANRSALHIISKIVNGKRLFYPRTLEGKPISTEEWVPLQLD